MTRNGLREGRRIAMLRSKGGKDLRESWEWYKPYLKLIILMACGAIVVWLRDLLLG